MEGFSKREKAFEAQFTHDEELRFRVMSKRNRMLGHWAAKQMGLSEAAAVAYGKEIVAFAFTCPEDEQLIKKVCGDFEELGVEISAHRIQKMLESFFREAHEELHEDTES